MPQQVGSGAALFDFNNDGLLDIYLLQNGGPKSASTNRLYQQMPDGHFQDVSKGSGLDIAGHNMGVAIGDVNNDGWLDVLVTQYRGVKLFLNNGDGTFKRRDRSGRPQQSQLGHFGRVLRLRSGRLARPDRRQLRRLRSDLAVHGPYGKPDYLRPEDVQGAGQSLVPQSRRQRLVERRSRMSPRHRGWAVFRDRG